MVRSVAQKMINRALAFDPETQERFSSFSGKVIKLYFTDFNSTSYICLHASDVDVIENYDGDCDAAISGSFFALAQLGAQQFLKNVGKPEAVSIEGDLEFVQQLLQLSKKYRFDWEEILAKALGDVVGHQVNTGLRSAMSWLKKTSQTFAMDMSEYLQDEVRVTPSKEEMNAFFDDVDKLREDLDRVSVKINRVLGE